MLDITGGGKGKSGGTISLIITLILTALIVVLVVKILKGLNTGSKIVGNELEDVAIANQTGVLKARVTYIRTKAKDLWDNAVTNWGLTYNYDEDLFVAGINDMVSTRELTLLNSFFKEVHKKGLSLKNVITEAFNQSEKNRLKAGFYQHLMST